MRFVWLSSAVATSLFTYLNSIIAHRLFGFYAFPILSISGFMLSVVAICLTLNFRPYQFLNTRSISLAVRYSSSLGRVILVVMVFTTASC